jgi:hypothetical protein
MLLLDSIDGAQLLFPGPFERACNETVFRLNSVILAPRPLGFVASALAAQYPLPLKLSALVLQLADRRDRDRNLIRRQGVEVDAFDVRVDRQGPDFLTWRTALLVLIGPAAVDVSAPLIRASDTGNGTVVEVFVDVRPHVSLRRSQA